MYRKIVLVAVAASFALVVSLGVALATTFDDTAFTYQGHLEQAGSPVTDTLQMRFRLYDDESAGSQVGVEDIHPSVGVSEGRFTVELDFGTDVAECVGLWLEIEVEGVVLAPRQRITGVPYAISTRGIFVDGDGNVGIANEDPSAPLDVEGEIVVTNDSNETRVSNLLAGGDFGVVETFGTNDSLNFQVSFTGNVNTGAAVVLDQDNFLDAGILASSGGNSSVFANVKNFRMPNPREADTEIVYACVEGPEAAAYLRGTATLVNGEVFVPFPQHFMDVATIDGMTVQLTPRSAESKGLAVIEQAADGFIVKELMSGTGNYQFNWHATAIRRGYEDYQVIQPALHLQIGQVVRPSRPQSDAGNSNNDGEVDGIDQQQAGR